MKVILTQAVPHLGQAGDQVDVARGYARNYLIPRKLAVEATATHLRSLQQLKAQGRQREERLSQEADSVAERLRSLILTFARAAGDQDRLFGSVTSSDIAEALAEQGIRLDRKKIVLEEPIKAVGRHAVPVRLHRDTVASIQVQVVSESGSVVF
ncbi:MAG: 50S ribosomal protein L9 [candidate division NC10 bacterium CSP1-5]|nr:MAG: 50S ribosomal protein L9 [candidate division NC10 bacterium CSP1-5]